MKNIAQEKRHDHDDFIVVGEVMCDASSVKEVVLSTNVVIQVKKKCQALQNAICSHCNAINLSLLCSTHDENNHNFDRIQRIEKCLSSFCNLSLSGLQVKQILINAKVRVLE